MIDLTRHPRLLKLLSLFDRAWAFAQRRNRGRRDADRHLAEFYERVWRDAAAAVGAEIEPLGHGAFEVRLGDVRTRVLMNTTAVDDLATHCLVRTKPVVYRLLGQNGLPTPRYVAFDVEEMGPAVAFLEAARGDCVVKPASGTGGGLGITTGIRTRWQLARAAWAAGSHGGGAIIEEQVAGDNYRLLYLDGKLIDAVLRRPPSVTGDGTSTVYQLVCAANAARVQSGPGLSHGLLTLDLDMKRTLAKQGLSFSSVPPAGKVVSVKTAINENCGPDNVTVTDRLCESIIEDGSRAAEIAGVHLAGVDVITTDPRVPLAQSGGVILEVNSPPGYYWHYQKRDGAFPVAVHVLDYLLGSRQNSALCPS